MRRIRRVIYYLLFAVMVITLIITMQRPEVGASIKPLRIPIYPFAQILLFFGLAGSFLGFAFRYMEIKLSESDTDKYLLAKSSVSSSRFTAIISLIFMLMLLLPPVINAVNENITTHAEKTVENTTTFKWQFSSSDTVLRAVYVSHIYVESDIPVDMYLMTSDQLKRFESENFTTEPTNGTGAIICAKKQRVLEWPSGGHEENLAESYGFGEFYIVIINNGTYSDKDAKVQITASRRISTPLLGLLVLFSGLYFVSYLVWMFVMTIVKGRYKRGSMIK
ncbi:MAG: hypothetical protein QXT63_05680 [Thermoplasmata archaeon]